MLLRKVAPLDIRKICSLHGPVLSENLDYYLGLYNTWSSYTAESEGVVIAYTSIYGNTKTAVELLAEKLRAQGVHTVMHDLARGDMFKAVEDAFRYGKIVLATTTYNADVFPFMRTFIHHLTERNFQNRTVALIENGSWAPCAAKVMRSLFEKSKNLTFTDTTVTIKSALNQDSLAQIDAMAAELCREFQAQPAEPEASSAPRKQFVCSVCGWIYEGDALPSDIVCPLCKQGANVFEEVSQ